MQKLYRSINSDRTARRGGGGSFINELRGPGQARNKVEEYKLIYPAGIFEYLFSPGTRYSGK